MPPLVLGRYLAVPSPVHDLAPEAKLLAAGALMGAVFGVERAYEYPLLAGVLGATWIAARVGMAAALQALSAVGVLVAVSFVLQVLFTPGGALLQLGPLSLTREGLYAGLKLAFRLGMLSGTAGLIGLTTTSAMLAHGITRLVGPLRWVGLSPQRVGLALGVGLRFVPVLLQQGQQIMNAQRARGIDFSEDGLLRRAGRLVAVLIPLIAASLQRADALALAMTARGYALEQPRTTWRQPVWGGREWGAVAVAYTLLAVVFF